MIRLTRIEDVQVGKKFYSNTGSIMVITDINNDKYSYRINNGSTITYSPLPVHDGHWTLPKQMVFNEIWYKKVELTMEKL